FDVQRGNDVLRRLRLQGEEFISGAGAGAIESEIAFSVEARYPHQVWEIEVPLRRDQFESIEEVEQLRRDFHSAHEELFAVRDADAPVEIVTWRARVSCALHQRQLPVARPEPSSRQVAERRQAYFPALGSVETPVRQLETLSTGERLIGPLIVESP